MSPVKHALTLRENKKEILNMTTIVTILIIIGAFFAACWILGALSQGKGIFGFLANLVIWVVRKAWAILVIAVIAMVLLSAFN